MVECELKNEIVSAHETALKLLRAQLQREEQPQPLTLDEIKERDGKPVYDAGCCAWRVISDVEYVDELCSIVHFTDEESINLEDHSEGLYATEPKGDAHV